MPATGRAVLFRSALKRRRGPRTATSAAKAAMIVRPLWHGWTRALNEYGLFPYGLFQHTLRLGACGGPGERGVLAAEGYFAEQSFSWPQCLEEALGEIEEIVGGERLEAGGLQQLARGRYGEKLGIDIDGTPAHNGPGHRIPGIVLDDAAQSARSEHPADLSGKQRSILTVDVVVDADRGDQVEAAIPIRQFDGRGLLAYGKGWVRREHIRGWIAPGGLAETASGQFQQLPLSAADIQPTHRLRGPCEALEQRLYEEPLSAMEVQWVAREPGAQRIVE
jgi:hypothetical protein